MLPSSCPVPIFARTMCFPLGVQKLFCSSPGPYFEVEIRDSNTDEKIIKVVEDVMIEFNKEIVCALEKKGCPAR